MTISFTEHVIRIPFGDPARHLSRTDLYHAYEYYIDTKVSSRDALQEIKKANKMDIIYSWIYETKEKRYSFAMKIVI